MRAARIEKEEMPTTQSGQALARWVVGPGLLSQVRSKVYRSCELARCPRTRAMYVSV